MPCLACKGWAALCHGAPTPKGLRKRGEGFLLHSSPLPLSNLVSSVVGTQWLYPPLGLSTGTSFYFLPPLATPRLWWMATSPVLLGLACSLLTQPQVPPQPLGVYCPHSRLAVVSIGQTTVISHLFPTTGAPSFASSSVLFLDLGSCLGLPQCPDCSTAVQFSAAHSPHLLNVATAWCHLGLAVSLSESLWHFYSRPG